VTKYELRTTAWADRLFMEEADPTRHLHGEAKKTVPCFGQKAKQGSQKGYRLGFIMGTRCFRLGRNSPRLQPCRACRSRRRAIASRAADSCLPGLWFRSSPAFWWYRPWTCAGSGGRRVRARDVRLDMMAIPRALVATRTSVDPGRETGDGRLNR